MHKFDALCIVVSMSIRWNSCVAAVGAGSVAQIGQNILQTSMCVACCVGCFVTPFHVVFVLVCCMVDLESFWPWVARYDRVCGVENLCVGVRAPSGLFVL